MPGPAERELDRAARLLATIASALIAVVAGALALLVMPPSRLGPAVAAVALLAVWRAVYVAGFLRVTWPATAARFLITTDVVIVAGCALAQQWIDVPYLVEDAAGWVQSLVVVTAVSYPWLARWRGGLAGGAVLAASFGVGASLDVGPRLSAVVLPAFWVLGNTALSCVTAEIVRAGARRADEATARRERAQADLEVAQARRSAEREHLAALHDTAAATLLMVGLGTVHREDTWLAAQAGRDLLVLAGSAPPDGSDDLVRLLRGVAATSALDVTIDSVQPSLMLPADVATAFANASREALRNVRRHAGVGTARISLSHDGDAIRLEVADDGTGLPAAPPGPGARGIRHSIVERMERVNGHAVVAARSPRGTVVRLEWADA